MTDKNEDKVQDGNESLNPGNERDAQRQQAAQAGGYNAPGGVPVAEEADTRGSVQPDANAALGDEDASGDVDRKDGDRITGQAGREAAGPFTGTGNQDALRTSGRQGASDAHHADQRTVEADASDNTNKEADKATKADAKEQKADRD